MKTKREKINLFSDANVYTFYLQAIGRDLLEDANNSTESTQDSSASDKASLTQSPMLRVLTPQQYCIFSSDGRQTQDEDRKDIPTDIACVNSWDVKGFENFMKWRQWRFVMFVDFGLNSQSTKFLLKH